MKLKDTCSLEKKLWLKSRDITLPAKVPIFKTVVFSSGNEWLWELDHKEGWVQWNWCFWIVLEKTLQSPLDSKEIKPVSPKGNQSWKVIERTDAEAEAPILWPPDAKRWLIRKDLDAGKDWRHEEKETNEDEMVEWYPWLIQEMVKGGEAWRASVYGVAKSQTRLSNWTRSHF